MLGLPRSTQVNRRVAKEKLYSHAKPTSIVRELIKDQIDSIFWRNKLADSTIGVASGETIKEIQVFEIVLRQKELDKRILPAISKAIPYKILFLLTYQREVQAWMEVSNTFFCTDWLRAEDFTLMFKGLNLDDMYENLARQIAGGRLDVGGDIAEAVERDKKRQRLEREIAVLERKIAIEKQFNLQFEMNGELKRQKIKLEELTSE
ncbi:MAG: DUF4391 domain-containing protein [Saccharofermentanales bacterium]